MFIAKNNVSIAKTDGREWIPTVIAILLDKRTIINGAAAMESLQFKPLDTDLDVLYVSRNQLPLDFYVKMADQFGKMVFPELTAEVRSENVWTPKNAIEICLKAHGCDLKPWDDGAIILTNGRSVFLTKLYAAETEYLNARKIGTELVTEKNANVCVFVDPDVTKRFKMATSDTTEVTIEAKTVHECISLLNRHIQSLQELTGSLRNQDPGKMLELSDAAFQKGETLSNIMANLTREIEYDDQQKKSNIEHL